VHATDDGDRVAILARMNTSILSWGCVGAGRRVRAEHLDCGTWSIETQYFDINKLVYVEAALPGAFDCK